MNFTLKFMEEWDQFKATMEQVIIRGGLNSRKCSITRKYFFFAAANTQSVTFSTTPQFKSLQFSV